MKSNSLSRISHAIPLIGFFVLLFGLESCKDDVDYYETPEVSITPAPENGTIIFEKEAGIRTFTIKTNRKWSVGLTENSDWIAVTPTSGDVGEQKIQISVLQNSGDARETQITITASSKRFVYNVQQKSVDGQAIEYTPLSVLTEMAKEIGQAGTTIEKDLRIRAVVTTDYTGKQFPFAGYHHIQDGEGNAIVMTLPRGGEPVAFGTQVTAKIKGCKLSNYNGTVQLEIPSGKMVLVPDIPIEPRVVTLDDVLAGNCINQYIRINELQFEDYEGVKFFDGSYSTKRHNLVNKQGKKATLDVWKTAVFGSEVVPAGSGTLTCVATINISASGATFYNLRPSTRKEIDFNAPRFAQEEETLSLTPLTSDKVIRFEGTASESKFTVKSEKSWIITKEADWLTINPAEGNAGETALTIAVSENSGEERTSKLKLSNGEKTLEAIVSQKAKGSEPATFTPLSKLQEIGATVNQTGITIEEDLAIQAVVVSDHTAGQFPFQSYHHIQDAEGNGIVMTLSKGSGSPIPLGTQVTVESVKGCKLVNYYGTIQLEVPFERIAQVTGMEIPPRVAIITDILAGKHINQLVRLEDVQFKVYEGETLYSGDKGTKQHELVDKAGNKITLEVYKYCKFGKETIPSGSGSVTAIATINVSNGQTFYNIRPVNKASLDLAKPRF